MEVNITFGIIVLNGEPFTRYCIHALYPHAHEIIISEGACEGARNVSSPDGHSCDGTLEILREIKRLEDPENKITIVTAEDEGHPNGFWPGEKHEQSRAYAKRATGNFIWHVDIDEFYKEEDMQKIIRILHDDPNISCISFLQIGFWGGFNYTVNSWYFKRELPEIFRIFKWGKGYQLITHRPPTVVNENKVDVRSGKWLKANDMKKMGIVMYHYSFVFPKQVKEKALYYKNADWSKRKEAEWWANDVFLKLNHPYNVFSIYWIPSWLATFKKEHPKIILQLINDISSGKMAVELRKTDDIEKLLKSLQYKTGIVYFKLLDPLDLAYKRLKRVIKPFLKSVLFINKK